MSIMSTASMPILVFQHLLFGNDKDVIFESHMDKRLKKL